MTVKIERGTARGSITAPKSKSMAHRLLICAALCEGTSTLKGVTDCADVRATVEALRALGAEISISDDVYLIHGISRENMATNPVLFCNESGSTMRFLIPVAAFFGKETTLHAAHQLMRRPFDVYENLFEGTSVSFKKSEEKITISGMLHGGEYSLAGNVSSQFISGLLFALPLMEEDSVIKITTPIESRPYIDMTIAAMRNFGVNVALSKDGQSIFIKGGQAYKATDAIVEGDFSGAAFPAALNLFGGEVNVLGLDDTSLQGDKIYKELYPLLKESTQVIDIQSCPDLAPVLFAVAAALNGAEFINTARLKIKESDRASAMAEELSRLGVRVDVFENSVKVYPSELHAPHTPISSHGDHRIVMAMAILLTLTGGEIEGADAVNKSYPDFFSHLSSLGISVRTRD
jgi:3-phosphoshikimate 1-carboxyvinyltransferase